LITVINLFTVLFIQTITLVLANIIYNKYSPDITVKAEGGISD